jgi:hypothetical protein
MIKHGSHPEPWDT